MQCLLTTLLPEPAQQVTAYPKALQCAGLQLTEITTHACRLLREPRAKLNQLPRKWLGELLGAVRARGQHRNDIVRRSAGLPFALMGLFLAEPPGSHKVSPVQLSIRPSSYPAAGPW